MKKAKHDELRRVYRRSDLGKGVRGKYLKAYRAGTNLVLLEPDVAKVFHSSDAVNDALRSLLKVSESTRRLTVRSKRTARKRAA